MLALIFVRTETHIDLRYFKDWLFILITMGTVFMFGVKPNKSLWIIPVISVYAFFRIQASANFPIFYQFVLFQCGLLLIYSLSTNKLNTNIILNSFVVISLISSVWIICESYNIDIQMFIYKSIGLEKAARMKMEHGNIIPIEIIKPNGPLGQHTITGALIACCIPAFFREKYFVLLPVIIWAIYLCNSAMSFIACLISSLVFIIICYWRVVYFLLPFSALPIILYKLNPVFFSDNGRIFTWTKIIKSYGFKFWGMGNGWFYAVSNFKNQGGEVFKHAHCELIDLYIAFGIPGIIITIYLLTKIRITNKNIFCIFIALMVNSLANLTYHISVLSLIAIICYSILTGEKYGEEKSH